MQVLITGGLGFIGANLYVHLVRNGYTVFIYSHRTRENAMDILSKHPVLKGYEVPLICDNETLPYCEIVVNLAGESIASNFLTAKRLKSILYSRLDMLSLLERAYAKKPPLLLIGASATGVYKNGGYEKLLVKRGDNENTGATTLSSLKVDSDFGLNEEAQTADNIYASLVRNIEESTRHCADTLGCKCSLLRLGVVVGNDGGIVRMLKPLPRLHFLPGDNFVPHMLIDDTVSAIQHVIEKQLTGIVNMVSPLALRLNELMFLCQKNAGFTVVVPRFGLYFDRRGGLLLCNQIVCPKRLLQSGFLFSFEELNHKTASKSS